MEADIPIPDQIGKVVYCRTDAKPDDDSIGNFCDGFHCKPCDFRIQIVSKTGTSIRLHFGFASPMIESDYDDLREGDRVVIDLEIPYDADLIEGEMLQKNAASL